MSRSLEPERIRSFKFCQSVKISTRPTGIVCTFYHATVKKMLYPRATKGKYYYCNLKSLIIVVNETMNCNPERGQLYWNKSNVQIPWDLSQGTVCQLSKTNRMICVRLPTGKWGKQFLNVPITATLVVIVILLGIESIALNVISVSLRRPIKVSLQAGFQKTIVRVFNKQAVET
jgi:hypothetical protein